MNKINYQKIMESVIDENRKNQKVPKLLLHSCCAPCSSYCLELLSQHFEIVDFFYNPNIFPPEEYEKRLKELDRFIGGTGMGPKFQNHVTLLEGRYDPDEFFQMAKGLEQVPEGGERCFACFRLRLTEAAIIAKQVGADYFTTTLTISPLKNAQKINEIGLELEKQYGVRYLCSDFKKKNGYKRSIELSAEYGLYRQNFCGCVYSRVEK